MKKTPEKKIGLWLDHSKAHFVDVSKESATVETTYSDKETQIRIHGEGADGIRLGNNRSTNNEYHTHTREQEITREYYKTLSARLRNYDEILLFGSSGAKDELYNILKADQHFSGKTIKTEAADQLTENQMIARVKSYFNQ
ncbi:MAG TPA: hypothetical protein PLU53_10430 [Bacteroidia bacterium]|nr:hypothetical protein [Bacteroidia bacterium]